MLHKRYILTSLYYCLTVLLGWFLDGDYLLFFPMLISSIICLVTFLGFIAVSPSPWAGSSLGGTAPLPISLIFTQSVLFCFPHYDFLLSHSFLYSLFFPFFCCCNGVVSLRVFLNCVFHTDGVLASYMSLILVLILQLTT